MLGINTFCMIYRAYFLFMIIIDFYFTLLIKICVLQVIYDIQIPFVYSFQKST